jgi:hypothetical protein
MAFGLFGLRGVKMSKTLSASSGKAVEPAPQHGRSQDELQKAQ